MEMWLVCNYHFVGLPYEAGQRTSHSHFFVLLDGIFVCTHCIIEGLGCITYRVIYYHTYVLFCSVGVCVRACGCKRPVVNLAV